VVMRLQTTGAQIAQTEPSQRSCGLMLRWLVRRHTIRQHHVPKPVRERKSSAQLSATARCQKYASALRIQKHACMRLKNQPGVD